MGIYPDIPKQTFLWYSSSKCQHMPIYLMKDRHLLAAIGVVQRYALMTWQQDEDAESDSNWHDYVPETPYVPLVKECIRRFLDVPGEDLLRSAELAWTEISAKTPPCCCLCRFRPVLICTQEDSPKFGTLRPCLDPCEKYLEVVSPEEADRKVD